MCRTKPRSKGAYTASQHSALLLKSFFKRHWPNCWNYHHSIPLLCNDVVGQEMENKANAILRRAHPSLIRKKFGFFKYQANWYSIIDLCREQIELNNNLEFHGSFLICTSLVDAKKRFLALLRKCPLGRRRLRAYFRNLNLY